MHYLGDDVFEDVALRAIQALWERRSTIGLVWLLLYECCTNL